MTGLSELDGVSVSTDVHIHHPRRLAQDMTVQSSNFDGALLQFKHDRADFVPAGAVVDDATHLGPEQPDPEHELEVGG